MMRGGRGLGLGLGAGLGGGVPVGMLRRDTNHPMHQRPRRASHAPIRAYKYLLPFNIHLCLLLHQQQNVCVSFHLIWKYYHVHEPCLFAGAHQYHGSQPTYTHLALPTTRSHGHCAVKVQSGSGGIKECFQCLSRFDTLNDSSLLPSAVLGYSYHAARQHW